MNQNLIKVNYLSIIERGKRKEIWSPHDDYPTFHQMLTERKAWDFLKKLAEFLSLEKWEKRKLFLPRRHCFRWDLRTVSQSRLFFPKGDVVRVAFLHVRLFDDILGGITKEERLKLKEGNTSRKPWKHFFDRGKEITAAKLKLKKKNRTKINNFE